jgi:hypothetical protein
MTLPELLHACESLGVRLSVRLVADAPVGVLTAEHKAAIETHRAALLVHLAPAAQPPAGCSTDAIGEPLRFLMKILERGPRTVASVYEDAWVFSVDDRLLPQAAGLLGLVKTTVDGAEAWEIPPTGKRPRPLKDYPTQAPAPAPPLFSWAELSTWRWGPSLDHTLPGIVVGRAVYSDSTN